MTCECGGPLYVKKTMQCKDCYMRAYRAANADKWRKGGDYWKPWEPKPKMFGPPMPPSPAKECGYQGAHSRVRAWRGRPSEYTCRCGSPAQDWSYNGGSRWEHTGTKVGPRGKEIAVKWSTYIWDYTPLCKRCHLDKDTRGVF